VDPKLNIAEKAAQVGTAAAALVRKVRLLGILALISAIWLWLLLFVFVGSIPHFLLAVPAGLLGLILLLPGAVVLVATLGLSSLGQLPQRLRPTKSTKTERSARKGPIGLIRRLWEIRREILSYKGALIAYAGAIRLFTLPVLLIVSLGILASLFQISLAALSLPLVLLSIVL
jgi:hypothetical protein